MSPFLVGVDVGSSACKCMIVDEGTRIIIERAQSYPTHYPQTRYAEQDPEDWYKTACRVIRSCLESSGIKPASVIGVAVAGPAHSVALMGCEGDILQPTIHWSDLRSTPQTERLEAEYGDAIFETTLCRVNPAWTVVVPKNWTPSKETILDEQ